MPDELTPEEQAIDTKADDILAEEALLETTRHNLDAVFGNDLTPDESEDDSTSDESDEDQTEGSETEDESTSEEAEEEADQTDESEDDDDSTSDESDDEQTEKSDSEADDEHALTQAEVRAAIHLGWSQDEIDALSQANPELAKKTCAKALESTNNLSKKFSELGKVKAEPEPKPETKPESEGFDFSALEKQYEDDPIVGVLKQVVEQNQTLAKELGKLQQTRDKAVDTAQAQEDAAIAQQIDTFFDRPDVKAFAEVYGETKKGSKDWDALTQGQIKKRWSVVEEAQRIMRGAEALKEEMPLEEAFERAHLLVTEGEREQVIRKQIKAKAVKRAKSITLEPTGTKKVPHDGPKTMDEVHANAKRGLRKLFGR